MDPLTAALTFGAALLNYATEVRRDMAPELKAKLDSWVMADLEKLRGLIQLEPK